MSERVRQRVESHVDEDIERQEAKRFRSITETTASALLDNQIVNTSSANEVEVKFVGSRSEKEYAVYRYYEFDREDVGMIIWIEVDEELRGNGLGRLIRKTMLEEMDASEVYSHIISTELISVAIDQGFKQVSVDGMGESWYVRKNS